MMTTSPSSELPSYLTAWRILFGLARIPFSAVIVTESSSFFVVLKQGRESKPGKSSMSPARTKISNKSLENVGSRMKSKRTGFQVETCPMPRATDPSVSVNAFDQRSPVVSAFGAESTDLIAITNDENSVLSYRYFFDSEKYSKRLTFNRG